MTDRSAAAKKAWATRRASDWKEGYIYALSDPRVPWLPLYFGKTTGSLQRRLWEHRSTARRGRYHRDLAIRRMCSDGLKPLIWKVETCATEPLLNEAERAWIAAGRAAGVRLWNHTDGGEQVANNKGRKLTPEHRAKISAGNKGKPKPPRSEAHCAAMSEAKRKTVAVWLPRGRGHGWHHSTETRGKIGKTRHLTALRLRRETSRNARKDV
jgi:hypothetical protein